MDPSGVMAGSRGLRRPGHRRRRTAYEGDARVKRSAPKNVPSALLFYRVMAFATGVVLLAGTILLIVQEVGDVHSIKRGVGWLWVAHGYLYLIYLVATLNLGVKLRWNLVRMVLIALAGTIPTMSFVAEHFVTRKVRAELAPI
jgi:integral membrane protein